MCSNRPYPDDRPNNYAPACAGEITTIDPDNPRAAAITYAPYFSSDGHILFQFALCLQNPQGYSCPGGYGVNCNQNCQGESSYIWGTGRGCMSSYFDLVDGSGNVITANPSWWWAMNAYDQNGPCGYPRMVINRAADLSTLGTTTLVGSTLQHVIRVRATTMDYIQVNGTLMSVPRQTTFAYQFTSTIALV